MAVVGATGRKTIDRIINMPNRSGLFLDFWTGPDALFILSIAQLVGAGFARLKRDLK